MCMDLCIKLTFWASYLTLLSFLTHATNIPNWDLKDLTNMMIRYEIIDTKVCGKHFNLFYFMGTYNYEVIYGMLLCMLWIETRHNIK